MKKFFQTPIGKRVMIGLVFLALAVALGFSQQELLHSDVHWKQAIVIFLCGGTGLGGLLYLFLSRKGLLIGYGIALGFSLLLALPDGWKRVYLAVGIVVAFATPKIKELLKKRKDKRIVAAPSPNAYGIRPMRAERRTRAQETKDKPIFALHTANGNMYQVFFQDGVFLFYKVGSVWKETKEEDLLHAENLPPMKKGDFSFPAREITWLRFRELEQDDNPFDQQISIHAQKRRYYLSTIESAGGAALEQLLREQAPKDVVDERKQKRRYIPSPQQKRKRVLERVYLGICAVTLLADVAWMFLDVPYRLFACIALLPTPILLLMYYLFPNEVSIAESKAIAHGRVMMLMGLLGSGLVPFFRTEADFNFLQEGRYYLIVLVLAVLLVVQAILTSPETRIRKSQLILIGFVSFCYIAGALGQVNYLMDQTPPEESQAVVTKMAIHTGSKSRTHYVLDVVTNDGTLYSLEVAKSFYQETEVGEAVLVLLFDGALNIPYAEIERLP